MLQAGMSGAAHNLTTTTTHQSGRTGDEYKHSTPKLVVAVAPSDMDVLVVVLVIVAVVVVMAMGLQSCKVKSRVGSAQNQCRIRGCEAFQA